MSREYRGLAKANGWLLGVIVLLGVLSFALGQALRRGNHYSGSSSLGVVLLLLPMACFVGVLLNGGWVFFLLLKRKFRPAVVAFAMALLWYLPFHWLLDTLGALGGKIGG